MNIAQRACSHVFLISSPLQAFVADAILAATGLRSDDVIFFVEDGAFTEFFERILSVPIHNTRLEGRRYIAENLEVINRHIAGPVTLWVSDILWPMNNAVYTTLLRKDELKQVNFFDEGMVLYWQERLSPFSHLREHVKFRVLEHRLKIRFTAPAKYQFYNNRANGSVFALHPHLLSQCGQIRPLEVDLSRIARIARQLEGGSESLSGPAGDIAEGSALVLSQPYYRIADRDAFRTVIAGLARHLRERGHERLYLKLHPSEDIILFDEIYRDEGFKVAFPHLRSPVEAVLQNIPSTCTLASFNSSALLNARKFGFKGNVLSYGLNWVAAQYPFRRNLARINYSLFSRANLEVVLA